MTTADVAILPTNTIVDCRHEALENNPPFPTLSSPLARPHRPEAWGKANSMK
jgi:hypothetical protein